MLLEVFLDVCPNGHILREEALPIVFLQGFKVSKMWSCTCFHSQLVDVCEFRLVEKTHHCLPMSRHFFIVSLIHVLFCNSYLVSDLQVVFCDPTQVDDIAELLPHSIVCEVGKVVSDGLEF